MCRVDGGKCVGKLSLFQPAASNEQKADWVNITARSCVSVMQSCKGDRCSVQAPRLHVELSTWLICSLESEEEIFVIFSGTTEFLLQEVLQKSVHFGYHNSRDQIRFCKPPRYGPSHFPFPINTA